MKLYHIFFLGGLLVGAVSTFMALDPRDSVSAEPPAALAWRSDEERRTIDLYRRGNEAVVFITTISLGTDPIELFYEGPHEGTGSGCIIDAAEGIVITNLHVVQDAQKIEITLASGENVRARLLGFDQETDLAVLKLIDPPQPLTALPLGDSSRLDVGQRVLAIGTPSGLNRTLTTGIISSIDRTVRISNQRRMKGLIQTDAAINPGNSGGPLIDLDGRLIGLNTAILSASGDSAGIGFAVPINQIRRVLPDLITKGRVLRPFIGWALIDTNQGPFIERLLPGSPADRAGVEPVLRRVENVFLKGYVHDFSRADLIYKVNGQRVYTRDEVEDIIKSSSPDEPIRFTLRRGGVNGRERETEIKPILR